MSDLVVPTGSMRNHMQSKALESRIAEGVEDRAKLVAHIRHRATIESLHTLLGDAGFTGPMNCTR